MTDLRPVSTTPRVRDLHTGWTLRCVGGPVPAPLLAGALAPDGPGVAATVPGTVHTDLMAAGLVPDPYLDDNERLLAWIGRCDWEYRTMFAWHPDDGGRDPSRRHDLALDGLDTVAAITLNGTEVGRTANQHRTYRFDVTRALRDGDNELVVRFASPVRHADAQSLALGQRPQVNHHPFNAVRKAACSFGWDWGIDTATSGIWRPVRLESWSTARLAAVRPLPDADLAGPAPAGVLAVHVDVEREDGPGDASTSGGPLELAVTLHGPGTASRPDGSVHRATATVAPGARSGVVHLRVEDAALWWPRGYGEQPLYDVEVALVAPSAAAGRGGVPDGAVPADGTVVDRWTGRTGFRAVTLDMTPDDDGTPFTVVVNGRPVWVKGANWIPDDAFFHRVDRARYARRLDQAEFAGLNLLRVWGGGLYESSDFYAECDERGLLVWQDFAFACAAYSEDEPLRSEVEAEARDAVTRLAPHPSLVLWNGSNENIWGYHDWGWQLRLDGRSWGLGYYTELLPAVVAELDGTRPYTPSSPWSGTLEVHPNDPDHGSMHSWEVWNQLDWTHYRDTVPRFMAEFGWQAPPTWTTLRRAVGDTPLTPESPGMQVHQKAMEGNKKLTAGLVPHVPLPDDMEDWHWAMQWNQAVAVRTAVEHLRSWAPRCTGSVVWQLNDCWPVTSWAAVDGDGRPKPLLHALAQAHADRLVTVRPRPAGEAGAGRPQDVVVVNDTDTPWSGELVVRRLAYDGTELAVARAPFHASARATAVVPVPDEVAVPGDPAGELVVADAGDVRGTWFFAEPRDSALAAPDLDVRVEGAGRERLVVRVAARTLVRDLTLLADKAHAEAVADRALVTLLPGQEVVFEVRRAAGGPLDVPDAAVFAAPGVLRSLNQLVRPAPRAGTTDTALGAEARPGLVG